MSSGPDAEHARAAVSVQRLDDDVLVLAPEGMHVVERTRHQRRRHQILEVEHEHFLGRIAHMRRIVDHQRLRVDALQQMRRRDVGHVERRVLPEQHHIPSAQVLHARIGELVVIARLVEHRQRRPARQQLRAD